MLVLLTGLLIVLILAFLALSPRLIKHIVKYAFWGIVSVFVLWRVLGMVLGAGKGRSGIPPA